MQLKDKNRKRFFRILRFTVLGTCMLVFTIYLLKESNISVHTLLNPTPKDTVATACVLLTLYIIKSATVFFPLIILEIAVGHFFSPWVALFINLIGVLIVLAVPYWIGHLVGVAAVQKMIQKYPKFSKILDRQHGSSFFLCFLLRIINCLPGDIVTMYLGATKTSFWKNLIAGSLGVLPGMVLATFIGESIRDPQSSMFWISTGLRILLAALSILIYYLYRNKLQKGR